MENVSETRPKGTDLPAGLSGAARPDPWRSAAIWHSRAFHQIAERGARSVAHHCGSRLRATPQRGLPRGPDRRGNLRSFGAA
jgi:hypothetical protein